MIKICFYSHTIDYAGTWRSHEKIFENINREIFDPYIMYWDECKYNNRLEILKNKFGSDRFIPFKRSVDKTGPELGYTPKNNNFKEVAQLHKFDIIHFARSGYYEFPFNERICPLQIETNIFGAIDNSPFIDKSISISKVVANHKTTVIIPNPISIPKNISKDFSIRNNLGISEKDIVLGRVGRPDNFDPIALQAYKLLNADNIHYFIVSPCEKTKKFIKDEQIKNIYYFDPTNDDNFLDLFHRNIDIFAHYRSDGEVHSIAISSAMSYALPIVSHYAGYNGQKSTIDNGGFVANNYNEYYKYLHMLSNNSSLRNNLGKNSRQFIIDNFEEKKIVDQIQKKYMEWIK
jgi:glycosyltransferase involved in cell wall biosynthesis